MRRDVWSPDTESRGSMPDFRCTSCSSLTSWILAKALGPASVTMHQS